VKVIIAAGGPTLESGVAKRFGHAPYYLLVDTSTGQVEAIDNTGQHDESHAIIPQMVERGVEAFITGNIGPHAFELVRSLQRQVALARGMSAGEALDRFQKGKLALLDAPTVKHSLHDHEHH
jgi:predicted Fe-Mo cluster-binding NifX family protein